MSKQAYLSRSHVARLFGVSPHTVTRWAKEGRLPSLLTPGGQRRYPRDAVERLAQALRQDTYRLPIKKLAGQP